MSKFDRCIFIFIGLGIWAFVLTQIFVPSSLVAHDEDHWHYQFSHDHYGEYAEEGHKHGDYAYYDHDH